MAPTARGQVTRHLPVDPDLGVGAGGHPGAAGSARGPGLLRSRRNRAMVLSLACGGALGAVARQAVASAMPLAGGQFPWGTVTVNVSGSFALGLLLVLLLEQFPRARLARPVLGTGFLGAYTTFSTFMVDAVLLVHDGKPATAAAYVLASLLAGLLAVWLGMATARTVLHAKRWMRQSDR